MKNKKPNKLSKLNKKPGKSRAFFKPSANDNDNNRKRKSAARDVRKTKRNIASSLQTRKNVSTSRPKTNVKKVGTNKNRKTVSGNIAKAPGKQIYFVNFPKGEKTNEQIQQRINEFDLSKPLKNKLPDNLMKVTVVAEKSKKERQSYTNIYRMVLDKETPKDINTVVSEIWKTITTRPPKNGKDYMKRINKLRGYVKTVIIDFETAGNEKNTASKEIPKT